MTNAELKYAMQEGCPVIFYNIWMECDYTGYKVTGIIYSEKAGQIDISAEIKNDCCPHSTTIVDPKNLRIADCST